MGDQQGSTRLTMRSAPVGGQLVAARRDYLPFGEDVPAAAGPRAGVVGYGQTTGPRQGYAGMEADEATGMSHTLWREYDSLSARWTVPDPYGGSMELSSPQTFNRYAYCNNDPANLTDPRGLMAASAGWDSVSGGFWGGGSGFFDPHFGGPGIINQRMAEQGNAINSFFEANRINGWLKDGKITKAEAQARVDANSNLEIEEITTSVTEVALEEVTVKVIDEAMGECMQDFCKGPPEMGGPYIADTNVLEQLVSEGKVVGDGDCVDLLQKVMGSIGETMQWTPGERVEDTKASRSIKSGTAIATFINGRYPNKKHGNHAAFFKGYAKDGSGFFVYDQYSRRGPDGKMKHGTLSRFIAYNNPTDGNPPSNTGSAFYVIRTLPPGMRR
jgi:RHS repeat-associated protein